MSKLKADLMVNLLVTQPLNVYKVQSAFDVMHTVQYPCIAQNDTQFDNCSYTFDV